MTTGTLYGLGGSVAVADGFEDQTRQPLKATEVGPLHAVELDDDQAEPMIAQAEDGMDSFELYKGGERWG